MTAHIEDFSEYEAFDEPERVVLGDGRVVEALGFRTIQLIMSFKVSSPRRVMLSSILYAPKLTCS